MKPLVRFILARAISDGVVCGIRRAYKHTDTPSQEAMADHIDHEVWNAIDEVFTEDDE